MSDSGKALFSEAAKLYAENASVVKVMHELCAKEYMGALARLFEKICANSPNAGFSESYSTNKKNVMESNYRYWHVGAKRPWEDFVFLWINQHDLSWVEKGVLQLFCEAGTKTPTDIISRMRAFPSLPQLAGICKEAYKSGRYRIFQIELRIVSEEELEGSADKIAKVLCEMKRAQEDAPAIAIK